MALTQSTEIGKIEISGPYKILSVRTDIVVKDGDKEISRQFHRHTVTPLSDLSNQEPEVQAVANSIYTQDLKDAYSAYLASL